MNLLYHLKNFMIFSLVISLTSNAWTLLLLPWFVTTYNTQRKNHHFSQKQPWSSLNAATQKYDSKSQPHYFRQQKYTPKCQYCDQFGYVAKYCPKLQTRKATTNYTTTSQSPDQRWLIDSAASHNITS